jgi:Mn2+/Fe2+ NRAMP family transporter
MNARFLRGVGPELLAAASDNDPTNVGTAAAVGAQSGYQLCWVALLVAPLLAVVIMLAAQVGIVARDDLQSLTRKRFGRGPAAVLLVSVVTVNLLTIAADLIAGAAGIGLLTGVDYRWLVAPLGIGLTALLFFGRYDQLIRLLRYLLLGFGSFGVATFMAHPDWGSVLRASVVPLLSVHTAAAGLALLGTTLTSYVYIWETIERGVEDRPDHTSTALNRAKIGAVAGSIVTAALLWFMLVVCAATLSPSHVAIVSVGQAAASLRPLAGQGAEDVFAVGLVVSALVALPVLMATTAHVVGAQFDWHRGLSEGIATARGFYSALAAAFALALVLTVAGTSVIGVLETASVVGGLATPIGLVALIRLGRDVQVMGARVISRRLATAGWVVVLIISALSLLLAAAAFA